MAVGRLPVWSAAVPVVRPQDRCGGPVRSRESLEVTDILGTYRWEVEPESTQMGPDYLFNPLR